MQEVRDINWVLKNFWDFFKKYVVHKEQFISNYNEYNGSANDFVWSIFQLLLTTVAEALQKCEITEEEFYLKSKKIYGEMIMFLQLYEKKKSIIQLQKAYYYCEIKNTQLKYPDLLGFEIFSVNCCDNCDAFHKKKITIEEAIAYANDTPNRCLNTYNRGCRTTFFPRFP